jgi:hypothetical protein
MKKLLYILMLLPALVLAQTPEQNYVKTSIYRGPNASNPGQSVTYLDGLGRPIQKIDGKQSGTGKDIITHIAYDSIGRQKKEFLPFASGQNNLSYVTGSTLVDATIAEYQSMFGDSIPYSEKQFEASPLNRVLKQAAPGQDWSLGQGHEVRLDYQINADKYEAFLFSVTTSWNSTNAFYDAALVTLGHYDSGKLYKTITKDENWISGKNNTTEEFKDKEGHIVLKRTYSDYKDSDGNITATEVTHDTHYVYDDFGNLTYVIPPIASLNPINQTVLDNLCYQYRYDHRNRMAAKKLPGKDWEYIAYNNQDMPVATGPVLSPFGGTLIGSIITKYDAFGRVVYTGWLYKGGTFNAADRVYIQNQLVTQWKEEYLASAGTYDGKALNYTNTTFPI